MAEYSRVLTSMRQGTAEVVSAIDRRLGSDVDTPVDTNAQNASRETATQA